MPDMMTSPAAKLEVGPDRLVGAIEALVPLLRDEAAICDEAPAFPARSIAALRAAGALLAPMPGADGGLGFGTEPGGVAGLVAVLGVLGRGSIAVGRLYEGHVNALKLIALYGGADQRRRAAADAAAGHLFAIWNTEPPPGLRLNRGDVLAGGKIVCSGAGYVTRPLVTARRPDEPEQMLVLRLAPGERVVPGSATRLHGVRAAVTASMSLDDLAVEPDSLIGAPGDYLRQPEFSAGAWRGSAVALGGLDSLVALAGEQLVARRRAEAPLQLARLGEALVAAGTARLWTTRAAEAAELGQLDAEEVAATVNLARIAVEAAALDAMRLVTRSLGLAGLVAPNPVERILRDLATYLRQPAPDETLTEAAAWFVANRRLP